MCEFLDKMWIFAPVCYIGAKTDCGFQNTKVEKGMEKKAP